MSKPITLIKKFNLKYEFTIKFFVILLIFALGIFSRVRLFEQEGGDQNIYKSAVTEFSQGINPYKYTVTSYNVAYLPHGYAYFPTLLYVQTFFYNFITLFDLDIPIKILWKIPVLLADIGVGVLLSIYLFKKNIIYLATALFFWFFNPYFFIFEQYTNYESLVVFFLLLSLMLLEKKEKSSAVAFALAVSLKTFPIILLPIYLLKVRNKFKFLLVCASVGLIISLPFMTSVNDFILYLKGSLLVHGERGIAGRPLFTFLTYYTQNIGFSFYQAEFSKFYTYLALLAGPIISIYLYLKEKQKNLFILVFITLGLYMLFTPVFNRTHIIWFVPFLIIGLYEVFKNEIKFLVISGTTYILFSLYMYIWIKGFKTPLDFGGKVWMDPVFIPENTIPFGTKVFDKVFHLLKLERFPGIIP